MTKRRPAPVARHTWCHITSLCLIAVLALACGGDPSVQKRQLVERGDLSLSKNKLEEAIIHYRNAIRIDDKFGEARKKLADVYTKSGNASGALREFVRAADLLPTDAEVQLAAGTHLLLASRSEDALARADAALKLEPTSIEALVLRGNALAGLRSFDEALEAIEEALRLDPGRDSTFASLGAIEMARGRKVEAEAAFKKAVELSPESVDAHLALGNFYWAAGKPKETEQAFARALRAQPDHGGANRAMAALVVATGRYRDAEPYLRRLADASTDPSAVITLADYYLAFDRAKEAIPRLESMSGPARETPAVEQRLARAYAAAGEPSKARALVDQGLARSPSAIDLQLLKGQLLLNEDKGDQAFTAIQSAASANPSSAEAQFALGRLYAMRGDDTAAEGAFRKVLTINPRASAAKVEIARLQLSAGKVEDSVRTAEDAAKGQPENVAARLTLVRSLLASNDLARAGREVAALQSEQPNLSDVHVQAGFLAILRNDVPGARRAFERADLLNPGSLDVLSGLIAADLKTSDVTAAKARLEKRLAESSTPTLLVLAARTYLAVNDQPAAERSLRAAIDADPTNLQPYPMLGQLYLAQRKLDQARTEFEALAARQMKPVGALTMVGTIHQARGDMAAARKKYEEVLALDSRAAIAANNLARMYAESGENLDVALQLAQTATAVSPDVPELIDTLGWVYYKRNLPQLAIDLFQRCVEKTPMNATFHYHLGLAYLQAGDAEKGKAALRRALAAGPVANVVADIRRLLGE